MYVKLETLKISFPLFSNAVVLLEVLYCCLH